MKLSKKNKVFNGICAVVLISFFIIMTYMYSSAVKVPKKAINKEAISLNSSVKVKDSLIVGYLGDREGNPIYSLGILSSGNTDKKELRFTAIHEKTMVNLEGYDKYTFGDLYKEGGIELLIKGMNSTFDLDIDKYTEIDFSKIDKVVNSLGNITLPIESEDIPFIDSDMKQGNQELNGEQVIKYYRYRGVADSDFNIEARCITVMNSILVKTSELNFFKAPKVLIGAAPAITTNFSNTEIVLMFSNLIGKNYEVVSLALPIENTFSLQLQKEPNIYYIKWDEEVNKRMLKDFVINGIRPSR